VDEDIFMGRKDRIFLEVIVGLVLITAAVYFFVDANDESIWPAGRIDADSGNRLVMGTLVHVIAVAADSDTANGCIDVAFEQIEKVDELMSTYKSDSQASRLNRDGFKHPVRLSKSTFEVLQKAIEISKLTGGAFDVTVGPLVDLWRSAGEANSLPDEAELQRARLVVGYDKLILDADETSARFAINGMKADLGGIAKGYAIDKAVEAMQKNAALGGLVEIGGDVRMFGAPPKGKNHWMVGLQDPGKVGDGFGTGRPLLILKLSDASIATSGDYRRFVLIGGKKYSHIIDARTGHSSEKLTSVTIISPSATDADALATAVSVMGAKDGLALIETIPLTEAILISKQPNYEFIKTSGAEEFILP